MISHHEAHIIRYDLHASCYEFFFKKDICVAVAYVCVSERRLVQKKIKLFVVFWMTKNSQTPTHQDQFECLNLEENLTPTTTEETKPKKVGALPIFISLV